MPRTTIDIPRFRTDLADWYSRHARKLPWRGIHDPYRTWVSEIMLQQTRVAAVIEHYHRFLTLFPTVSALASATEPEVLAAWSGLGYYRRARMMHKAAQHIVSELGGTFPQTAAELRALPGIGSYTSAAIASITWGESIAVLDGNVERVLLRILGHAEDKSTAIRKLLEQQAQSLVPPRRFDLDRHLNTAGDHNQAMMELGATLCTPRAPLCLQCPVVAHCRTRGEHTTPARAKPQSRPAAYYLETRTRKGSLEVLLEQRPQAASLMAGMYELPPLPLDAITSHEPLLQLRHAITNTLYAVSVYEDKSLRTHIPAAKADLHWTPIPQLPQLPLTGLTRKILKRHHHLA